MTPSLPLVLDETSLPLSELRSAVLDGDLRQLGGSYCSIDVHPSKALRALSLAPLVPDGLVAERMTAAWLHGATTRFRTPLQLCMRSVRRVRAPDSPERVVRQVVLADTEVVRAGTLLVTHPLRTALDLLRWLPRFDPADAACVSTLLLGAGASLQSCRIALGVAPHLPHKQRALSRLDEVPGFSLR